MLKKDREKILKSIIEDLELYNVVYFVDFQGLNVEDITDLRRRFIAQNTKFRVAKNTLIKLARKELKQPSVEPDILTGSTALVMSHDDPVAPARIIKKFLKDHEKPQVKAIIVQDTQYDASKFKEFASLPSLDELRAKAVGSISNPLYGIVFVLSGLIRGLVTQINQLANKEK